MVLVTANRYIDECHPTVPDSLAIYSGVPQFQYFPELIYGTKEVLYLHCQLYYKDTPRCALRGFPTPLLSAGQLGSCYKHLFLHLVFPLLGAQDKTPRCHSIGKLIT